MTSPVLVTGGTGTLGQLVVARLRVAGRDVRVLSRHDHDDHSGIAYVAGDLAKGVGLDGAVDGIETLVHCAGGPRGDDTATANLVRAATRSGVAHLVYISIVNAELLPIGYCRRKVAAEQIIADSGLGWTTLRAAQFHDLVLTLARRIARLPVVPVPSAIRFQPVDADEVAARLVELSLGAPAGRAGDLVGPKVQPLAEFVRGYLTASGTRRRIVAIPLPGKVGRAYRDGQNLAFDAAVGMRTWEEFLTERVRVNGGAADGGRPRIS